THTHRRRSQHQDVTHPTDITTRATHNTKNPASNTEHQTPNIQNRTSTTEHATPNIQHRTSNAEHPTPNIQRRTSNTEHPTPNIQHRTSNAEHRTNLRSNAYWELEVGGWMFGVGFFSLFRSRLVFGSFDWPVLTPSPAFFAAG